ncbi:MAG TPA: hypothetical protein DIW30_08520 [Bacteroidales bacterium]|nr:hypothetical protein [Bacteroidales bacterium]
MNNDASDSAFILPEDVSSRWQDIRLLQSRRHSVLYRGKRYGRWFILKGLPAEQQHLTDCLRQQEKEFRLGIQLVHPNIAATYSLEDIPDCGRCIVQEAVDGQTMDCWLATKPDKHKRLRVMMQLLDAVEYLHARQLVHHDLKPGNILITHNGGNLKLFDFGLSDTDDSASPAPNDLQDDLCHIADVMDLLHLRSCKRIANACRRKCHKNIAELRRDIVHREKTAKVWRNVLSGIIVTGCAVLLGEAYVEQQHAKDLLAEAQEERRLAEQANSQAQQTLQDVQTEYNLTLQERTLWEEEHQAEKQRKQAMTDDVMTCMQHEKERLEQTLRQNKDILQTTKQFRWIPLRDSLANVYADDPQLQAACLSLIDQQYLQLQSYLQDLSKELSSSTE